MKFVFMVFNCPPKNLCLGTVTWGTNAPTCETGEVIQKYFVNESRNQNTEE